MPEMKLSSPEMISLRVIMVHSGHVIVECAFRTSRDVMEGKTVMMEVTNMIALMIALAGHVIMASVLIPGGDVILGGTVMTEVMNMTVLKSVVDLHVKMANVSKIIDVMVEKYVTTEVMKKIVMCGVWNLNRYVMVGSIVQTTVMKKAVFVTRRQSGHVPVEDVLHSGGDVIGISVVLMEVMRKAVCAMRIDNGHVTMDIVSQILL